MKPPSATQSEVIARLRDQKNKLVRLQGGFWTTPDTAICGNAPVWSVDIRSVRSMENKGLLERTHEFKEEWKDPRRLTVVGGILVTLAMSTQKAHEHLTDIGKK